MHALIEHKRIRTASVADFTIFNISPLTEVDSLNEHVDMKVLFFLQAPLKLSPRG